MKKLIALVMVMVLCLSMAACAAKDEKSGTKIAVQKGTTALMYAQVLKGAEAVSYDTFALAANDMKNGNAAYVFVDKTTANALCKEISGIKKQHVRMELDGTVLEDDFIFGAVCNSTSVGGVLTLAPSLVDLSDGKFEVLLVRTPKDITEFSDLITSLNNQTYDCKMLTLRSASKVTVKTKALSWSLDGEYAEGANRIEIENLHNRLLLVL